jgi:hypothetical protein
MIACIACMDRAHMRDATSCLPCSCLCHEPPGVTDCTGPVPRDVSDEALRSEPLVRRTWADRRVSAGRDLTDREAYVFATTVAALAGVDDHGEGSVQLAKALIREHERVLSLIVPNDTMSTLRAFAANARARREFPRTVDAVALVLSSQDGEP